MHTSDSIVTERPATGVAVVRLNRPERRNALDSAALALLVDALDQLAADDELRALVVSTTSTRALCAGADVGEPLDHEGGVARMDAFTRVYARIDAFPVPTIAVCVGNCVGAGAEIAAGCDLRVGGDNLRLAWAGARLGVPVGPARLAPLVGLSAAKDLIYTGRAIDMAEAAAIGFLNRTAGETAAESVALELAAAIAGQSPTGVRVLKQMFRDLEGSARRVEHENALLMEFQRSGAGLPKG